MGIQGDLSFWTSLQLPISGKPHVVSMKRIHATEGATVISCISRKYRGSCVANYLGTTGGAAGVAVTHLMVVEKLVVHRAPGVMEIGWLLLSYPF